MTARAPHLECITFTFPRDRLSANDFIQIRKVQEHVYEKVLGGGSDAGSTTNNNNDRGGDDKAETTSLAEERVQLLCNDKVRSSRAYMQDSLVL